MNLDPSTTICYYYNYYDYYDYDYNDDYGDDCNDDEYYHSEKNGN